MAMFESPMDDLIEDSFVILSKDEQNTDVTDEDATEISHLVNCPETPEESINSIVSNKGTSEEKILKIIEENTLLKERLCQNNEIIKSQYQLLLQFQKHQQKLEEDEKIIANLNNDNLILTEELMHLKEEEKAKQEDIHFLQTSVSKLRKMCEDYVKRIEKTEEQLEKVRNELEQTQEQVQYEKSLKQKIENLESELAFTNKRLLLSQGNFVQVKTQLEQTKNELQKAKERELAADQEIVGLNREILTLNTKLQQLEMQTDEIDALKRQLRLFREDLVEERSSYKLLLAENEKLEEELRNLRTCCHELQREQNQNVSSNQSFCCPICKFNLYSQEDLQVHVIRCLDQMK